MIVRREGGRVRLFTRRGFDWTHRFGWIAHSLQALRVSSVILHGEMVICDADGISVFAKLHSSHMMGQAFLYVKISIRIATMTDKGKDHLDIETKVSAALTEHGITASAKSRTIAAFDRLGGNFLELLNAPLEKRTSRARALSDAENKLIEAAAQTAAEHLRSDPNLARRALQSHFEGAIRAQVNKDSVLVETIEDMEREPPRDEDDTAAASELGGPFMRRFERHAEEASTQALQQRWGRVLAREIRKPGTFSSKALRVVDELESETALLFEKLCESRLSKPVPKCLSGNLTFNEVSGLSTAGLMVEPGLTGQVIQFQDVNELWMGAFGADGLAFSKNASVQSLSSEIFQVDRGTPGLPVYVLTDVGEAIGTMLPNKEKQALFDLAEKIKPALPDSTAVQVFGVALAQ